MAGPTVGQKIKNHFKRNYKFYFAIGLALTLGLTLFLLTLLCPPVAFVVAGTFSFIGLEAIAGLATLALAAVAGGILTGISIFLSLAANLSHRVKNFFDDRWMHPASKPIANESGLLLKNKDELSNSNENIKTSNINTPPLNTEEDQLVTVKEFPSDKEGETSTTYRIFRNKNAQVPHDLFTFEVPSFNI